MRALLTSNGITTDTLRAALVELLGRPIEECDALFVPIGVYPFPGGFGYAADAVVGPHAERLADLGWRSLGLLELSVLPSIDRETWLAAVRAADAILVWGGDPLFIAGWLERSGLAAVLPELGGVYVGVSAGSMAACAVFGESAAEPPSGEFAPTASVPITIETPDGDEQEYIVLGRGAGLVDAAIIPHFVDGIRTDTTPENAARWAAVVPATTYALDDASALRVVDGVVDVVSTGEWRRFEEV